ncbi:cytochrome C [Elizabethkingia argentiflava]|uniref:Cytochrome C n=1 Tax=Elizabethkingia argenteiflava TaxID=2681556 RepID=A0A845PXM9_9FLAO|nr:heme-binding domain-containing protein [Elizabethkingia argenteiflava]NAW51993.1 cytochrome C [Elizabethkingia argenteiflava]
MLKKILLWSVLVFALIQLIPVDRKPKPIDRKNNFADIQKTPIHIASILRKACYDCHSNETQYPWYAYVAPISWTVKDHVNEGRARLNYSEWYGYNEDQKKGILQKSISTLQQRTMPMAAYMIKHPEANLTLTDRNLLIQYFKYLLDAKKQDGMQNVEHFIHEVQGSIKK